MKAYIICAAALLCLAACGNNHDEAHHHDADEHEENSNIVHFSTLMMSKVDFAVDSVRKELFGQVIHTVGQIQPRVGAETAVVAATSGIITYVGGNLAEGCLVEKGQGIFYIESGGMADNNMQVRLATARSEYELAAQTLERKRLLSEQNIVSKAELERAKSDFERKEAVYNALNRNFSEGRQLVTAPKSGYISGLMFGNGHFVEAGEVVAHIVQPGSIQIVAEVQPRYFEYLKDIDDIVYSPLNSQERYSMNEQGGHVVSYGRVVSQDSPLIPVTFTINPMDGVPSGAFIDVFIRCKGGSEVMTVPAGAVVEEMGSLSVYVQTEPEHFEKRQVTVGVTDGRRVSISSGLFEGEQIVSRGAVYVKLAGAGGKLDAHAGHVH